MMSDQDAIAAMDDFWSRAHGSPGKIHTPGVQIAASEGADRVLLLKREETLLVSAPKDIVSRIQLSEANGEQLFDQIFWTALLGIRVDRIIGPAYLGFLTQQPKHPKNDHYEFRDLTAHDTPEITDLRRACDRDEWGHSAIDEENALRIGTFVYGKIVSAAGYQIFDNHLAFIGVITHPKHRAQGHGITTAAAIVSAALSKGLLPIWRTLLTNQPSIKAAKSLGFKQYAITKSIRMCAHTGS